MSDHDTADTQLLDRAFHSIMTSMTSTAQAPHFTELATELGLRPEEGRELVHQLMGAIPGWAHPGTDYIASFPPFNVQPTQYRISVDGRHGWFGQ